MKLAAESFPICLWIILEHKLLSLDGPWAPASLRMFLSHCQVVPQTHPPPPLPAMCMEEEKNESPCLWTVTVQRGMHLRSTGKMQTTGLYTPGVLIHLRNWHFYQNTGLFYTDGPRVLMWKYCPTGENSDNRGGRGVPVCAWMRLPVCEGVCFF